MVFLLTLKGIQNKKMKKILVILLVLFIIIQFFRIDKTNPPINNGMDFLTIKSTPENIAAKVKASCYDCHSNETKYPWYTNIQPVAWFMKSHIDEGRKHLNFSTFATYEPKRQAHKLYEVVEMIENDEMPLQSYVLGHSEAKLSAEEKQMLIDYFKKIEQDTRIEHNLPAEESKK